jgi:hypothetical protein
MISTGSENNMITRGWVYASVDSAILLTLTALCSIFYERGGIIGQSLISLALWSITPTPCKNNEEGCVISLGQYHDNSTQVDCMLKIKDNAAAVGKMCNLIGESLLYERKGVNLFSAIGVPFLLLSSQVISSAFSLIYIRNDSMNNTHNSASNVQKTLKKMALLMMIIYATTFLFLQNSWKIPENNLFLSEVFLLFSIFTIGFFSSSTFSDHAKNQTMPMRIMEFVLTIPFLAAIGLAVSGNTSIHDITTSFFSVMFANGFMLLLEMDKDSHMDKTWALSSAQWVIMMNAWVSILPFIIHYSIAISALQEEGSEYSPWVLLSTVVILLYELFYLLSISIYNILLYSTHGKRILSHFNGDRVYLAFVFLQQELDVLCIVCKALIYFGIMGGALSFEY